MPSCIYAAFHIHNCQTFQVLKDIAFNEMNGDRPNASNSAIFITDGFTNVDSLLTSTYAKEAHAQGSMVPLCQMHSFLQPKYQANTSVPKLLNQLLMILIELRYKIC